MNRPLRVGVVTPHRAPGPEVELPAMTDGRVTVVLARTAPPPTADDPTVDLVDLEGATETFRGHRIDVVAHASTTTGYVVGRRAEADLVARLAALCGVPAVATCSAAVAALDAREVERVQLVHPPWFAEELDELGCAYFRSHGLDVLVSRATELPLDPALVQPAHVIDWVEGHVDPTAQAVFLAGNGFRSAAAVRDLERRLDLLVLASNQALLHGVLAAVDGTARG